MRFLALVEPHSSTATVNMSTIASTILGIKHRAAGPVAMAPGHERLASPRHAREKAFLTTSGGRRPRQRKPHKFGTQTVAQIDIEWSVYIIRCCSEDADARIEC